MKPVSKIKSVIELEPGMTVLLEIWKLFLVTALTSVLSSIVYPSATTSASKSIKLATRAPEDDVPDPDSEDDVPDPDSEDDASAMMS